MSHFEYSPWMFALYHMDFSASVIFPSNPKELIQLAGNIHKSYPHEN